MLLAAILAIGVADAQTRLDREYGPSAGEFGAGLVLGDPTGVSLGWRPTEWNAVEVGLGYDLKDGDLKGSADYLQSIAVFDPSPKYRVPIYVGVGAGVGRDVGREAGGRAAAAIEPEGNDGAAGTATTDVAARVPVGASILLMDTPVEMFAHVIPSLRVLPDRRFDVDGAVGVRYYF